MPGSPEGIDAMESPDNEARIPRKLSETVPIDQFQSGAMTLERSVPGDRIHRADRDRALPLSFTQQRFWRFDRLSLSKTPHVIVGVRLLGTLDRRALRAALDRVVARHEVLRTTFPSNNDEPLQVIGAADSGFALVEQVVEGGGAVERLSRQEAEF
jgi:hypothetical protein